MTNETFKDIGKFESDLWEAADNLRANSKLTSSDYFMPVLGVIFIRHAANRSDAASRQIEAHFKQHASGAVFDAIIVDTFKLIPFILPDEKKVRLFEETVTPIFRQVANLMEQNERLRTARDLLLPRLMSGEIPV